MANNSMGTKKVEELLVSKSMPLGMQFYVPNYQRGYRWKESQVQQLLNDIKEFDYEKNNEKKFYCLQPLVVTEDKENGWVVIDGQQRLTTLFIILTCIEKMLYKEKAQLYQMNYQNKPQMHDWLEELGDVNNDVQINSDDIDAYHITNAYLTVTEVDTMEVKDIIYGLRVKKGLSQDALARKVMVTRQAVSRWENGETVPNTETLKLLSKEFDVSINTLLGTPRKLICQCCGMPLEDDEMIGRDKDGSINEDYCRWCYADGTYTYSDMEDLINVCVKNMVTDNFTEEQARSYMKELLPKLDYWKRYDELSDHGEFEKFKKKLLKEINALHVEGLPEITRLNALVGKYVNLEYTLPNGRNVKFLDDQTTYLGTQSESEFEGDRYFGVLAGMDFILICTYEADRTSPELVLYKKR